MKTPAACFLFLAASVVACAQDSAKDGAPRYGDAEQLCILQNQAINESSGVAVGRLNAGLFWTHNDSGDKPRIFAFDATGQSLATVAVAGAKATDWEDIASFTLKKKHYLLLADVGDNRKKRGSYELYIVLEPRVPPPGEYPRPKSIKVETKIAFSWRGGPQNCEAVAVHPEEKTIYLATREESAERSRVFTLPLPSGPAKGPRVAEPLLDLPHRKVTGMDMSPDGRRVAVVTYSSAFLYTRGADETWKQAFAKAPQSLRLPRRKQGEAVCYGSDERSLYLTTEKLPAPVHVFRAKSKPAD